MVGVSKEFTSEAWEMHLMTNPERLGRIVSCDRRDRSIRSRQPIPAHERCWRGGSATPAFPVSRSLRQESEDIMILSR